MVPDFVIENLPVVDLLSDIYLLATVWPRTVTSAPSSLEECSSTRALWYTALAFTMVGTLVDLFPELMLLTDLVLHPRIFRDRSGAWKVAKLLCSDGKPIISFAASQDEVGRTLGAIRASLRKRLHFFGRGYWTLGDYGGSNLFMYSGLLGCLAAGELLTAVGGVLLLAIDFGWPALVSVVFSVFSFLATTRSNMMKIAVLDASLPTGSENRAYDPERMEFNPGLAIPGPVAFLKLLLGVPVWPLSLVAWGVYRDMSTNEFLWVWPPSWLGASEPSVLRVLDWLLFPHYVVAWVSAAVLLLVVACCVVLVCCIFAVALLVLVVAVVETLVAAPYALVCLVCWYFGNHVGPPDFLWPITKTIFEDEEFDFELMSLMNLVFGDAFGEKFSNIMKVLELAFGSGMEHLICCSFWDYDCCCFLGFEDFPVFEASFVVQVVLLAVAINVDDCAEQEWAFASAHAAWFFVICCTRACVKGNPFRPSITEEAKPETEKAAGVSQA